jgi:RNA polymerase sigma-70 factor (ECF subfamily)
MSRADEQRFRALYDRTYDRLVGFVRRRIDDEHAAHDVVADTWVAVWRRIRDVPDERPLAEAWVFGTARRILANHRRAQERRGALARRLAHRRIAELTTDRWAQPTDERLLAALADLDPADRELLALAVWDELSRAQIAFILGVTENAVSIRLSRARAALRRAYEALAPSAPETPAGPDATGEDPR